MKSKFKNVYDVLFSWLKLNIRSFYLVETENCKNIIENKKEERVYNGSISSEGCHPWQEIDKDYANNNLLMENNFCRNPGKKYHTEYCHTSKTNISFCKVATCGE